MNSINSGYWILGGFVLFALIISAGQTLAVSTSEMLLINTNPSGATATLGYTGQVLGTTPVYIDPRSYSATSPTSLVLSKSGYQTKNTAIYSWMTPPTYISITYNLKPLSGTTPTPTTDNPPSVSASHSPASPTTSDNVVITASASDDKGLSQITVYADNAAKVICSVSGTSASCPYGATFSAGTHSYYATAKDNAGKTATSSTKQFSVSSAAPAPAPTGGMTIDSKPSGADVYYLYGANDGKYMGRTPFIYDPSIGFTYIKFVKPGYQNSIGRVYPAMAEKNNLYVANLYPI